MVEIEAVILAAGLSKRMGANKLLLPLGDSTVAGQFLAALPFALFERTIMVYHDKRVAAIARAFPVTLCHNDNPGAGISRSIQLGVSRADAGKGLMFLVADQPFLTGQTVSRLIDTYRSNQHCIVQPEVNGVPGNPVIFPAGLRPELLRLEGDAGGRQLIRRYPGLVRTVPFVSEHEFYDIDTPQLYQRVVKRWNQEK